MLESGKTCKNRTVSSTLLNKILMSLSEDVAYTSESKEHEGYFF